MKERPPYSNKEFIGDLWHFLRKHKGQFIFFSFLIALAAALVLIPPIVVSKIIDFFTNYSTGQSLRLFYVYIVILLVAGVAATFLRLGGKHFFTNLTNKIQKEAKIEAFQKLMEGDLVWHDKENTGNKMQKMSDGISSIGAFMDFYINQGIAIVISLIGIVVVFSYFSLKYTGIALLFMGVYLTAEFWFNKRLAKKTLEVQIAKEKAAGKTYEFSSNIATVKSLGIEKSLNKEMASRENDIYLAKNSRRVISTSKWLTIQIISTIFYALFIFAVGKDIVIGLLTIGSIVIYVTYVTRIQIVLNEISNNAERLTDIKYSVYRMMDLYRSIPQINEEGNIDLKDWSEIIVEDVSFKYKKEEVLENFSLKISKGERIGVVGKSGSGKSTLFKLLLKLYLPQEGMVYFDKMPVSRLKKDSIVKRFSIVPQETELFNMSFKDNILVADPGKIDYKRYRKALELSQSLPVIRKMKDKDLTLIGEKGVRLSGGERQRLGIARALYKNSDILIFDEATSNLDYETERKIQQGFDKELKNKTMIFAAHRFSTLKSMDRILVIEKGKIIEEGSYDELLSDKGEFYRLLRKQGEK